MKRSGKILLEGTIEEFKKHCKGADNREYLLINTKEIKKDGIYTIYQLDSNTERVVSISTKGKHGKQPFVPYDKQYLTFMALSNGTFLFTGKGTNAILYSTDNGETWSESSQTVEINVKKGNSVLWKGEMAPYNDYRLGIGTFNGTATFNAKGNIMSLLFGDNYIGKTSLEDKINAFSSLWLGSKIVKAHSLSLPATILSLGCYSYMFSGCTSLTTAPTLPATTLANLCYESMFSGTNVLPDCANIDFTSQTVVASGGLKGLFGGTKVTDNDLMSILPINPQTNHYWLPVTTLAVECYYQMFKDCQYLVTAPELPAAILTGSCYRMMFKGCTHLNHIVMLATNISATQCLYYWVENVASSGTFTKNASMTSLPLDDSGIPSGWIVKDFPPDCLRFVAKSGGTFNFSGTTTSNTISYSTDQGKTWSTPAQVVSINVNNGDTVMWKGEMVPTNNGIGTFSSSTAVFDVEGNIMSLLYNDYLLDQISLEGNDSAFKSLFEGTNINNAESLLLPATTLSEGCYESMFLECVSLTKAPQLSAPVLTNACYKNMFKECVNLNLIVMLANDISALLCLYEWVNNVAEEGIMITSEILLPSGSNGAPLGWLVLDYYSYNSAKYLTLIATTEGNLIFKGTNSNTALYSVNDGETWSEPASNITVNVNRGDAVLWKGEMIPGTTGTLTNRGIGSFGESTAVFNVKGNIMSLLYGDNYRNQVDLSNKNYAFYNLFYNSKCSSAADLILPATTLANYCYLGMFSGCNSLNTAPLLPATTLANYCYNSMFYGCKLLKKAPELPASVLKSYCYYEMFRNCTSLNYIKMLATSISATSCLSSWVRNVAASGTFVRAAEMTILPRSYSGIPEGWEIEPPLPPFYKLTLNNGEVVETEGGGTLTSSMISGYSATIVSAEIYDSCTSIGTSAFASCSGLTNVTIGNSVTSINNSAFSGCTSLTSINIPSGVTVIGSGAFQSCSGLTSINIPDSVTSIGNSAFQNCTSLSSVTIGSGITSIGTVTFSNCSELTSITSLATTAPTVQSDVFQSVKANGTLYVPSGSNGYDAWLTALGEGWTIEYIS